MSGEDAESVPIVALVGATASGKARLAEEAARIAGAEILSCDSMKVYRAMEVGTAKPSAAARASVRWHAIDVADPHERFDASRWVALAEDALAGARSRGAPLLVAGGTVLYLKAWTEGLFQGPPRDASVRARIRDEAAAIGSAALHARLASIDPIAAARIHPNDLRRIERALEVHLITGKPISALQSQWGRVDPRFRRTVFAIARRRSDLDRRIDLRIDRMIAAGWIDECRALLARREPVSPEAEQALGYRELFAWLRDGEREPLDAVVARVKTLTRRFARKQENWLRHGLADVTWLDVPEGREPVELHRDALVEALVRARPPR